DHVLIELFQYSMAEVWLEAGHGVAGVLVLQSGRLPVAVGGLRAGAQAGDQPGGALLSGDLGHGPGAFEGDRLGVGVEPDHAEPGPGGLGDLLLDRGDVRAVVRIEPGNRLPGALDVRGGLAHASSFAVSPSSKLAITSDRTGW